MIFGADTSVYWQPTRMLARVMILGSGGCATSLSHGRHRLAHLLRCGSRAFPLQGRGQRLKHHPGNSPRRTASASRNWLNWDAKWRQIQSPADKIDWVDHFRVCTLKYRYRAYDDLLRCLDLFEAKISRDGKRLSHGDEARSVAPVVAAWLRSVATLNWDRTDLALTWAEKAWRAIPAYTTRRPARASPALPYRSTHSPNSSALGALRLGRLERQGR